MTLPKEALEYTVRAYQLIELQQMKYFDKLKQDALIQVDEIMQELDGIKSKNTALESELDAKVTILKLRDEQLHEIKEKMVLQEKEGKEVQAKSMVFELKNNELTTELATTKNYIDEQKIQHEKEINRIDSKLITLQDEHKLIVNNHQQLQTDNDSLKNKLSYTTEERNTYSEENKKIKTEKDKLVNNISGLKASNDALSDERKIQKKQIIDLSNIIEGLQNKVQSFEVNLQKISDSTENTYINLKSSEKLLYNDDKKL